MKKRLSNISTADFNRVLDFATNHPEIVKRHHLLQKLIIFNFVAPIVARHSPKTILEIGCGLGFHSALLTNHGEVWATEMQAPGSFAAGDAEIGVARSAVFRELAKSPVQFRFNGGQTLPFRDQAFDLVFHNSVIEHVPDPAAFNRETARVLKPGGIVLCITGTPALCRFRFVRDHILRLPLTIAAALAKEMRIIRAPRISDKIEALVPEGALLPPSPPVISGWYARLAHYVYSPLYNALVLGGLAKSAGITTDAALAAIHWHFKHSVLSRFRYYLTPRTHGQHYRDFRHEMSEWKLERWRQTFTEAGFEILEIFPYRFHHLLEASWSSRLNSALYHLAAPVIERYGPFVNPELGSEFILVARKR